jgi:coenzyme F420-0:L-glutamate ligase/coenzyme F420-1:gamma-L-glutamate ligase
VRPSEQTRRWAKRHKLDARVVELGLRESRRIVRKKHGVLITETRHGLVCANSGVDVSNVDGGRSAVLLPRNSDASAEKLYRALKKNLGFPVPVIISDSFGRAWREGLTEVAIGLAGMRAFRDYRGQRDEHGYALRVSVEAVADELACAAGLACSKLGHLPACIIRGFAVPSGRGHACDLIRPAARDLFR